MLGCFTELIDAVILTGGLANSKMLTGKVIDYLHNLVKVGGDPRGERDGGPGLWAPCASVRGRNQVHQFHPACAVHGE